MNSVASPTIIQGGMGAGVSGWTLARAVSRAGQLGVVAGTALDAILARRLQIGDPCGHMRRALEHFPVPGVAERILERYFIPDGKDEEAPFRALPLLDEKPAPEREELIVAANFVEIFLAKEGHDGVVGINYLEKIQLPTLPSIYGAMLAGVDHVLVGAGIPRAIPTVLDDLAAARPVALSIDVRGADRTQEFLLRFDPRAFCGGAAISIARPSFLAIASSVTVATVMARKAPGRVDGLIMEGSTAGGHNAPPRGRLKLNSDGEPIFGERDVPDLTAIANLGLPFWLAGSYGGAHGLREAQRQGATGIQVGTAFAFCEESGIHPELKKRAIDQIRAGAALVMTDPVASPTGFPFKVFQLQGTLSDHEAFEQRQKVCDLGYLRHAYAKPEGQLGWRCPAEPPDSFLHKGGAEEDMHGRKCVCNGLMSNIGLGQVQKSGEHEAPLLTSAVDIGVVAELLSQKGESYRASDVLEYLLRG